MADLTIVVGSKNYSSWSLRPWLSLKQTGAAFDEVLIDLDDPRKGELIRAHSPAGKVPVLKHGTVTVWESLAICEYLAEAFPKAKLWPEDRVARAHARTVASEMHAGFSNLRTHLSMNILGRSTRVRDQSNVTPETWADITRVISLWDDCRRRFGAGGPFLFGAFTNADAMFAPVVTRLRTYQVPLPSSTQAYCDAVWALPAMQEWIAAAKTEPRIPRLDAYLAA